MKHLTCNKGRKSPTLLPASCIVHRGQKGFTLTELLVVIFMMSLLATLFVANYNALRGPRNLRIAQNELVSNLRKAQSYTLSGRNNTNNNATKYYLLKFNICSVSPCSYTVQVIDSTQPNVITNLEVVSLPPGITIPTLALEQPAGASAVLVNCVQVAFSVPFSKIYVDSTCNFENLYSSPATLNTLSNARAEVGLSRDTINNGYVLTNGVTRAITPENGTIVPIPVYTTPGELDP